MRTLFNIKSISQFLFLIGFIFLSKTSFETTIYVNKFASGLNNGTSWLNAFNDLQDGLAIATSGDEIWVRGAAVYLPDQGTGDRTKSFQLKSGVELYGGFTGNETSINQRDFEAFPTILSGEIGSQSTIDDNSYTVVDASGALVATVDGFFIFRGNANNLMAGAKGFRGGGIYFNSSACQFVNCVIRENNAVEDGGGVFAAGIFGSFIRCTFLDNTTTNGNGGAVKSTGSITSSNTVFENCIFTNNRALSTVAGTGKGAAVFADRNTKFKGCVFRDNIGYQGSAIYVQHASVNPVTSLGIVVNNCTVINNQGLANDASSSAIHASNTLLNNEIKVIVNNSILYNNIANAHTAHEGQISSETTGFPIVLYLAYCNVEGYVSGIYSGDIGNIGIDPDFIIDPTGTSFHISDTSPCVNAGNPSLVPTVFTTINDYGKYDIDGEARISDISIDIGADEIYGRIYDPDIHPLKTDFLFNDSEKDIKYDQSEIKIYPNPSMSERVNVKYELYEPTEVNLKIISLNGQVIASIVNAQQDAGSYSINIFMKDELKLSEGVYFVSFKTNNELILERFIIMESF